jgi:hypothetical protein
MPSKMYVSRVMPTREVIGGGAQLSCVDMVRLSIVYRRCGDKGETGVAVREVAL